jgi:hypothetical protein
MWVSPTHYSCADQSEKCYFYSSDIESEKDFPPEYLSNVTRKEEIFRSQIARIGRPCTVLTVQFLSAERPKNPIHMFKMI